MFDGDLLTERARVTPQRLALVSVETGERITYGELDARVERAAATLRAALQPGHRFGLLAHNSVDFIELFFAAGRAGVIVVPLSTRATVHELEHIVRDCGMSAVFYGPGFEEHARQLPVARYRAEHRLGDEPRGNRQQATRRTSTASSTRAARPASPKA